MKLLRTIRNNWKKSVVGFGVLAYGCNYLYERRETNRLLQQYCIKSSNNGYSKLKTPTEKLKRVTIFLNPKSNHESSKTQYEKYVYPIMHLSGLDSRLVRLESKNESVDYMNVIDYNDTDCIVVAGGSATLSEAVTSLLTRNDSAQLLKRLHVGYIPLGLNNAFADKINLKIDEKNGQFGVVDVIGKAVFHVIRGNLMPIDVLKVDLIDNEDNETTIYALSSVSYGYESDKMKRIDNYWGFGPFKNYINEYYGKRFVNYKPNKFDLEYVRTCPSDCLQCFNKENQQFYQKLEEKKTKSFLNLLYVTLFSRSLVKQKKELDERLSKMRVNDDCDRVHENVFEKAEINASINDNLFNKSTNSTIKLTVKLATGNRDEVGVREFEIKSNKNCDSLLIDKEIYDLTKYKSVKVKLVKNAFNFLFDPSVDQLSNKVKSINGTEDNLNTYFNINGYSIEPFKKYYLKQ